MTPLQAQYQRICLEFDEAKEQLNILEQEPSSNAKMIKFYNNLISHNQAILKSLDTHFDNESDNKNQEGGS